MRSKCNFANMTCTVISPPNSYYLFIFNVHTLLSLAESSVVQTVTIQGQSNSWVLFWVDHNNQSRLEEYTPSAAILRALLQRGSSCWTLATREGREGSGGGGWGMRMGQNWVRKEWCGEAVGGSRSDGDGAHRILSSLFATPPPLSSPLTCATYRAGAGWRL